MRRNRVGFWALGLSALCLRATCETNSLSRFQYATPLRLPTSDQEELAELVLPAAAYRVTRDDLSDVHVVRAKSGEDVPFLLECVTEERKERVRRDVELHLVKAETLDGNRLQVTLERATSALPVAPLCGVVIDTPLRDFDRRVTVEASADGLAWQRVVDDARIFDVSSHARFSQKEVVLPAVSQRCLRLTVDRMDDVRVGTSATVTTAADSEGVVRSIERQIREEQRPFRVDGVRGWEEQERWVRDGRPRVARDVRTGGGVPDELKSRFPTARLLCFEAGRVPLERINMRSQKSILSLPYMLFAQSGSSREGAPAWRQVASGELKRLAFRSYIQEQMAITFSESRALSYCLVLTDGADATDLEVVGGAGPDYRVIFPYRAGQTFSLLAGAAEASGPAGYQPEQIRLLLRRGFKPVKASLDGWCENAAYQRSGRRFFSVESAWFLPVSVAFAILVLGGAVVLALRRVPPVQE